MNLATPWRVWREEGWRAVRDRGLDRLAEARRRRRYLPAGDSWRGAISVLTVGAFPPEARFGGVQAQWGARIAGEEALGPIARLFPAAGGWRLEVSTGPGGERRALHRHGPDFRAAVAWAAAILGARALHVEGAAGLPAETLLALAHDAPALPLLLALHDFALYCRRPHLLEEPTGRFCHYCRDLDRCAACLGESPAFAGRWRETGGALLAAARALVFPSAFLARTYGELFGALPAERVHIIPPALPKHPPHQKPPPGRPRLPPRHLALVGGLQAHKGAAAFAELVAATGDLDLTWSVYGGGSGGDRLGRTGAGSRVRMRGFYRAGSLPALLRRDGVDLAILPSVVPESFSLVLSECRAAAVPVLAFDLGAVGERLRAEGGGLTVPLESGGAGLASLLREVVAGRREVPAFATPVAVPSSSQQWRDLYHKLGLT